MFARRSSTRSPGKAAAPCSTSLYATADVILTTYEEIADVTLSFRERPYRLADPFATAAPPDATDDLFVAIEEPLGIVEVTVERT